MTTPTIAPYGSWKSPVTSALIASSSIGLGQLALDGNDVYWTELRPTEGGRNVIVRRHPDGTTEDVNPAPFNARTRVHEYGGGDFLVDGGIVYFANFSDQRLYRCQPGSEPQPLTHADGMRYADLAVDKARNRLVCVREDHSQPGEAVNSIVAVDLASGDETQLAAGHDFFSSPRLSPGGLQLSWLAWDHPNMPWDGCSLFLASVEPSGALGDVGAIAGGLSQSVFQPSWSPDGTLYFVSDRSGWWNLYRLRQGAVEPVLRIEAEFGQPQWQFGMAAYDFDGPQRIVCTCCESGVWRLGSLDTATRVLTPIDTPYSSIRGVRVANGKACFAAGSPTQVSALVELDLAGGSLTTLRQSTQVAIDPAYFSTPETLEFPTEGGLSAYGFYYPPRNPDFTAPAGELPPLLVMSHGGPTSAASATLSLRTQYWTSRGIAVLDVNYGGSTGYGRSYRERLNGSWGIVDVDDCVNGALFLARRGSVDSDRLAITGGSAGGYTTLCALAFRDAFKAGASHFGIGDLEALARDTHKFESRYLDGLVGPYPERRDLYVERAPIHHLAGFDCPVVFFQGLEDQVVPPNQAETMVEALRAKGVPVAYVPFEGEQHGFRRAENIQRALDGELYFYSRIFGFDLADPVEPLVIDNLLALDRGI